MRAAEQRIFFNYLWCRWHAFICFFKKIWECKINICDYFIFPGSTNPPHPHPYGMQRHRGWVPFKNNETWAKPKPKVVHNKIKWKKPESLSGPNRFSKTLTVSGVLLPNKWPGKAIISNGGCRSNWIIALIGEEGRRRRRSLCTNSQSNKLTKRDLLPTWFVFSY